MPKITVTIDDIDKQKRKHFAKIVDRLINYSPEYSIDELRSMCLKMLNDNPDYPADTHICDASGHECKQNAETFTRSENVQNKTDNFDTLPPINEATGYECLSHKIARTTGSYHLSAECGCDECMRSLIIGYPRVRQNPINRTQDGLCTVDETLPPINEATGHDTEVEDER